ncbi:hypothetical protein J6590_003133 [Homalodisca vitripennis]|nr:hypothetical protein J6590_003133 [Homalodisca vitripennis]
MQLIDDGNDDLQFRCHGSVRISVENGKWNLQLKSLENRTITPSYWKHILRRSRVEVYSSIPGSDLRRKGKRESIEVTSENVRRIELCHQKSFLAMINPQATQIVFAQHVFVQRVKSFPLVDVLSFSAYQDGAKTRDLANCLKNNLQIF